MAKGYEEYFDEDECCLECGEPDFESSKTPGLCKECHDDLYTGRNRFEDQEIIEKAILEAIFG